MDTTIKVTIQGKTPLLLNRFGDEEQMGATEGTRAAVATSNGDSPRDIAESKLYIGANGKPMVPGPNVFRAIIDAGTYFKVGRQKVTTQKSSLIPSCVAVEEIEVPIRHKDPWDVDTRPVRIPATGGRILRHRPCFQDWELSWTLLLDQSVMTKKFLREILDKCGNAIGIGDFRPACKGPYGKFSVTLWK